MKTTSKSPEVGFEKSDRLADTHLDAVAQPETLEISPRLPCVLLAAVGVEDPALRPDGAGEERGRVADGRAQLEDAPRADRPREHREQGRDGGTHDRDVARPRLFLHLHDHGMTGGQKARSCSDRARSRRAASWTNTIQSGLLVIFVILSDPSSEASAKEEAKDLLFSLRFESSSSLRSSE